MPCIKVITTDVDGTERLAISKTDYDAYLNNVSDPAMRKAAVDNTYAGRTVAPTSWMSRAQIYALTNYQTNSPYPNSDIKGIKFHFARNEADGFVAAASPTNEKLVVAQASKDPLAYLHCRSDQANFIDANAVDVLQRRFKNQHLLDKKFGAFSFPKRLLLFLLGHRVLSDEMINFEILLFPDEVAGGQCHYFRIVQKRADGMLNNPGEQSFYSCPKQCYDQ